MKVKENILGGRPASLDVSPPVIGRQDSRAEGRRWVDKALG